MVSLKCLNNFQKTLEMPLTNCEITLPLTCFQKSILAAGTAANELPDKKKLYDPPINNNLKKYDNIRKIATGQSDDYTTGFLLDYLYFKNYYKLIATE